jgi:hypothetical protein
VYRDMGPGTKRPPPRSPCSRIRKRPGCTSAFALSTAHDQGRVQLGFSGEQDGSCLSGLRRWLTKLLRSSGIGSTKLVGCLFMKSIYIGRANNRVLTFKLLKGWLESRGTGRLPIITINSYPIRPRRVPSATPDQPAWGEVSAGVPVVLAYGHAVTTTHGTALAEVV